MGDATKITKDNTTDELAVINWLDTEPKLRLEALRALISGSDTIQKANAHIIKYADTFSKKLINTDSIHDRYLFTRKLFNVARMLPLEFLLFENTSSISDIEKEYYALLSTLILPRW